MKNKMRKLSVILDDYDNILNDYKSSQPEELKRKINNLQEEARKVIAYIRKEDRELAFYTLVLCILLIFAGIYMFITDEDRKNLRRDNIEKTDIINKLQRSDSLLNQIMNVEQDSLGNRIIVSYRNNNDEIITYNELYKDNIEKTIITNKLQWSDSLLSQIMNVEHDSLGNSKVVFYRSNRGKIITYNELYKENTNLKNEVYSLRSKLDLVQENYEITFKETDKYISINAEKIDSALLLLPYYRNKLRYDQETKTWIITFSKNE
jgi:hypothetical protein